MSINWGEGQTWSIKQAFSPSKALHTCRQLYGLYFFLGGCFKLAIGLLWSDTLKAMFVERLADLPQDSMGSAYLTHFAIPWAFLIAYVLTLGELLVGFLFMKNTAVKFGALVAIFITVNIGLGGFFSWILMGFILFPFLLLKYPTHDSLQNPIQTDKVTLGVHDD